LRIATERAYPYVVAIAVGLVSFFWDGWSILTSRQSAKTLDYIFAVSAVALGFWGTAATLLLAVEEKSFVRKLKKGPHFRLLVGYIFSAITWQAVVMGMTLAIVAFSESIIQNAYLRRVITACWIAGLTAGILTTFRGYYCLATVLKAASSESAESG